MGLDRKAYARLQQLFEEARAIKGDRSEFWERVAREDPDLEGELRALLKADQGDGEKNFWKLFGDQETREDPPKNDLVRSSLGPYMILEKLDQGGMGSVYLAARNDEIFHKRVAIKVLEAHPDMEDLQQRFRQERQILAALDHPNICRLMDGGLTPDGRPYLVMDLIEGQPIDVYCDSRKLSVAERIRLFRTVCAAVDFAHSNMVVHLDLKPGNILVSKDGVVKLLDFGIAKMINPELGSRDGVTLRPRRMFTLPYASPEQLQGESVSKMSDVYALGAILYKLLTGHHANPLPAGSVEEQIAARCEADSTPMSGVVRQAPKAWNRTLSYPEAILGVGTGRLARRLAGDLDAIVLKALSKQPRSRYTSAQALDDDLGRHLEGYPVLARESTPVYRIKKFAQRRPWVVLLTAGLLAAGFMTSSFLGVQSGQLKDALRRAEVEAQRAEREARRGSDKQVRIEAIVRIFDSGDDALFCDAQLTESTRQETARFLSYQAEQISKEMGEGDLERLAWMQALIGGALTRLGALDAASGPLEASLEMRMRLPGQQDMAIAESQALLGLLRLRQRRVNEAYNLYSDALKLQRYHLGSDHPELIESHYQLGLTAIFKDRPQWASEQLTEALRLNRLDTTRSDAARDFERAEILNLLASAQKYSRDRGLAESNYRQALLIRRQLWKTRDNKDEFDSKNCRLLVKLSESQNNLGAFLSVYGDLEEALLLLDEALQHRQQIAKQSSLVAATMHNLAGALRFQGRLKEAEAMYLQAIEVRRKMHQNDDYAAGTLLRLANLYEVLGRTQEAEVAYLDVERFMEDKGDDGDKKRGETLLYRARILRQRGNFQACETLASEAEFLFETRNLPEKDWRHAAAKIVRASCLFAMGHHDRARSAFDEAFPILESEVDRRVAPFVDDAKDLAAVI